MEFIEDIRIRQDFDGYDTLDLCSHISINHAKLDDFKKSLPEYVEDVEINCVQCGLTHSLSIGIN